MRDRFINEGHLDRAAAAEALRQFLDTILAATRLELKFEIQMPPAESSSDGPGILVNFHGPDQELLLERHGELLLALEYIAVRALHLNPHFHEQIRLDASGYRAVQLEELKLSARVAAQRVRETKQPFHFNPMSSRERRIIHLELNGAPGVRTVSEDMGDRRHLVIYPAENKK